MYKGDFDEKSPFLWIESMSDISLELFLVIIH